MSLYSKLAEVEGKVAQIEDKLGLPQRRNLLVRHEAYNHSTRLATITDTLISPKPYITSISPRFANLPVGIEGSSNSIYLAISDLQVEVPRTLPKNLFIPVVDTTIHFVLEPPVNNNQVVYSNPTTKEIDGAVFYTMVMFMDDDPTRWKLILRKLRDSR